MRENRLFALYGMCAQALSEGILKYIFVCKWFKRSPISLLHYIFLWLPSVMISIIAVQGGFNSSFFAMMICVILTFILTSLFQLCDPKIRNKVFQKSKTLFRGAR